MRVCRESSEITEEARNSLCLREFAVEERSRDGGRQEGDVLGKDGSWAKVQKWRRTWCMRNLSNPPAAGWLGPDSPATLSTETVTSTGHFSSTNEFKEQKIKTLFTWLNSLNPRTLGPYLVWLFGYSVNENGAFQSWMILDNFRESCWPWLEARPIKHQLQAIVLGKKQTGQQ